MSSPDTNDRGARHSDNFPTTHWSVVVLAGQHGSPQAEQALETLCRAYWRPVYAYVRRRGHVPPDAQDLTQEFFARLLARNTLVHADRTKGRFRTFLLTSLNHFLIDAARHDQAQRRGGGQTVLSLDEAEAEGWYQRESDSALTPEAAFDRRWAWTVLDAALRQLQTELAEDGKARQFDRLQPFLSSASTRQAMDAAAADLGMTFRAVSMAVSRLRQRYRQVVREQIAQTAANRAEADEEMRYLLGLIADGFEAM